MELWERFSSHARRAVLLAHDETLRAKMQRIGTEHLLLGVLRLGEGMAVDILHSLEVDLARLRHGLRQELERGSAKEPPTEIAFTPEAQKVLQHAYSDAKETGQNYIGTEHLLVGLVRENRGRAHRMLRRHGVDLPEVREAAEQCAATTKETGKPARAAPRTLKDFGQAVRALARESDLDAVVLVIGRDGIESWLTTKPGRFRELLACMWRLVEPGRKRRRPREKGSREGREQPDAG